MKSANTVNNWIRQIMRPYVGHVVLLSVISALISVCIVAFALISRWLIDSAVGDAESSLLAPGIALMSLLVVRLGLNAWQNYLHQWLVGKVDMRIKQHTFSRLMCKEWASFRAYHSGELLNRMTSDSRVVVNGLVGLIPHLVSMITSLIACLAALFSLIDWRFVLCICGFGLLMLVLGREYGKRMKRLHKDYQKSEDGVNSYTQENSLYPRTFFP